jgi:hypothetical protein
LLVLRYTRLKRKNESVLIMKKCVDVNHRKERGAQKNES